MPILEYMVLADNAHGAASTALPVSVKVREDWSWNFAEHNKPIFPVAVELGALRLGAQDCCPVPTNVGPP